MRNVHSTIFSFQTKSAIKYQAVSRTCLNSEGLRVRFAGGGFCLEEGFTHDGLVLHGLWIGRLYHNLLLNLDLGCLKCKHAYYMYIIHARLKFFPEHFIQFPYTPDQMVLNN